MVAGQNYLDLNIADVYRYRFSKVRQSAKNNAWRVIAKYLARRFFSDAKKVLDPAAGRGEFLQYVDMKEKWAVDLVDQRGDWAKQKVTFLAGNFLNLDLPASYFDGVFISNLLEHLSSVEEVQSFLRKAYFHMDHGGKILIMGPNFSACYRQYFDFMDHKIPLTEKSVAEHLISAGFRIVKIKSRFLPYTFTSILPSHPVLVSLYLRLPIIWRVLGKQFLVIGEKK